MMRGGQGVDRGRDVIFLSLATATVLRSSNDRPLLRHLPSQPQIVVVCRLAGYTKLHCWLTDAHVCGGAGLVARWSLRYCGQLERWSQPCGGGGLDDLLIASLTPGHASIRLWAYTAADY